MSPIEKPRLLITTDIGGDPDDQQSMIRLMVYANAFQIEGLIASASGTPGEIKQAVTRPDLIWQTVDVYGEVRPNLLRHETGWPEVEHLRAEFVQRLRVYDIGDQDKLASWMRTEFLGLHYILAQAPADRDKREGTYRGMYLGGDETLTCPRQPLWIPAPRLTNGGQPSRPTSHAA